ncbi:hypothetical protein GWI33_020691 [Rhynchophorus ferrugineus]|uniref:Uncharacterized protein n=1 Tax=Rhynchophorus ferrugineus TaxID=354439 RepID=A0A834HP18_RHYFE|nr:hypothetical protein GWI33_020691 [Rhynchophorus ferrugineus]
MGLNAAKRHLFIKIALKIALSRKYSNCLGKFLIRARKRNFCVYLPTRIDHRAEPETVCSHVESGGQTGDLERAAASRNEEPGSGASLEPAANLLVRVAVRTIRRFTTRPTREGRPVAVDFTATPQGTI